eukprot:scaffold19428_cov22-Tisochrysis_lutea.AAC.2
MVALVQLGTQWAYLQCSLCLRKSTLADHVRTPVERRDTAALQSHFLTIYLQVHSLAPSPRSIEEQQQEGQEQHLLAQGNVAPSAGGRKAQKGKGKGGRSAAQRWESRGRATPTRTATQVQRGGAHRSG